ncbi:hypothetical protein J7384_14615 [Endozoicomonas sp. G2_1]|uniref:hypothetical protein n=1 Tax=Endozoicomonas sp. G2_1 TaxID=2821091 RepID=UPI001AD967D1|nr:hypothetical protein [Endozoicomonas sp. G2_1]MBO9491597.1 hypothetical protein [Endozoicomonas sp. G2_1]
MAEVCLQSVQQKRLSSLSLLGLLFALGYAYLAVQSKTLLTLAPTLTILITFSLLLFSYWYYLKWGNHQPTFAEIFLWAVVFRSIALVGEPILEDDFYRYLWDGFTLVTYGSPYGIAPEAYFDAEGVPALMQSTLDGINNPHIATIYGPVNQLIFALGYLIAPGQVWPLQLIFALFDLGVIYLLKGLTSHRNILLYAWSPLLIKEFAFTAHPDVMAVFFLLAASLCFLKHKPQWLGAFAALAVASKVFALVAIPLLLLRSIRAWLYFTIVLVCLYLPFADSLFFANSEHGFNAMSSGWFFNAPLYLLFAEYLFTLKLLTALSFIGLWCWLAAKFIFAEQMVKVGLFEGEATEQRVHLPRMDYLFAGLLLLGPVLNPWYWVWVLAFAAIWPSIWAWLTSLALLLSYIIGLHLESLTLGAYQHPNWGVVAEFGLVGLGFILSSKSVQQLLFKRLGRH